MNTKCRNVKRCFKGFFCREIEISKYNYQNKVSIIEFLDKIFFFLKNATNLIFFISDKLFCLYYKKSKICMWYLKDYYRKAFIEYYVLAKTIIAVGLYYCLYYYNTIQINKCIILVIAIYIILGTIIYQINVVIFDSYFRIRENKKKSNIYSGYRSIVLLGLNFISIIFSYGTIILYYARGIIQSWFDYLYASALSLLTFSDDNINKLIGCNINSKIINLFEIITGIILLAISLTTFLGILDENKNVKDIK
jgi:hypothetical protein